MRADASGGGDVGGGPRFSVQRRKRGDAPAARGGACYGLGRAWMARVTALDMYPKLRVEHRVKTASGAALSLASVALALMLFMSELREFASPEHREHIGVDRTFPRLHPHAWHRPWTQNTRLQRPAALSEGASEVRLVPLHFNVSLLRVPCSEVHLCVMDVSGRQQLDVRHDVYKTPVDRSGRLQQHARVRYRLHQQGSAAGTGVGAGTGAGAGAEANGASRAGAEAPQAPETPQAPGCNVHGRVFVSKVAGNVHFANGPAVEARGRHFHHFTRASALQFDASHILHNVSFGEPFPGRIDPLAGVETGPSVNAAAADARRRLWGGGGGGDGGGGGSGGDESVGSEAESYEGKDGGAVREDVGEGEGKGIAAMYQYFMKVVPTLHVSEARRCAGLEGRPSVFAWHTLSAPLRALMRTVALRHPCGEPKATETSSFQYSFTRAVTPITAPPFGLGSVNALPGLYLVWDFSPFRVRITERARSWPHFVARVCAVVGGAFSISGAIDLLCHRLRRTSPSPHGMLPR